MSPEKASRPFGGDGIDIAQGHPFQQELAGILRNSCGLADNHLDNFQEST